MVGVGTRAMQSTATRVDAALLAHLPGAHEIHSRVGGAASTDCDGHDGCGWKGRRKLMDRCDSVDTVGEEELDSLQRW